MDNYEYQVGDIVATYRFDEIMIYEITKKGHYKGRVISPCMEKGCYITLQGDEIKDLVL